MRDQGLQNPTDKPLRLSGTRFTATYLLHGPAIDAQRAAEDLCIEQTIEYPADLVRDEGIRSQIFGRTLALDPVHPHLTRATISFAVEIAGGELTQLLNTLFGNISLKPGIRLVDVEPVPELIAPYRGPRFGTAGLRELLQAPTRPLLATALKPMGLPADVLADLAHDLALGGIDLIKDDHGLADQEFGHFRERVERCSAAVRKAAAKTGRPCLYAPNVSGPADQLRQRARFAKAAGAGALLVAPGLVGFDAMRMLADDDSVALPILCHPALLGSFVVHPSHGIGHGVLLGTLARLGGADISIFPNHGGRFSFSTQDCREIVQACRAPLSANRAILPAPAGGMRVDRVAEMRQFYGDDVVLLIGGDLHRSSNLIERCGELRDLVAGG
jgi:ribulose-bisphosphate carboxylase large chain